jgi:hypothetical protein
VPFLPAGNSRPFTKNKGGASTARTARNELKDIGVPGGPVELTQPESPTLPHKVIATARPLEDGQYAAQLLIQRALRTKGTYAVEERWDQLGTFSNPQEAIEHTKSVAMDRLG